MLSIRMQLTDDGPVYHAPSVHLSPNKLIACFVAKFSKSGVKEKVPQGRTLISVNT